MKVYIMEHLWMDYHKMMELNLWKINMYIKVNLIKENEMEMEYYINQ